MQLFKNCKNRKELQKLAFEYIKNGNKNFEVKDILNDNKTIRFIRKGANEFVYGTNSKKIFNNEYKYKMRLTPSIDDLINKIIYKV